MWEETLKTYNEMVVDGGWSEKHAVSIDCINDYTKRVWSYCSYNLAWHESDRHQLALILICRCGFGLPFPWTVSSSLDGKADIDKSISTVSNNIAIRLAAPRWMYQLPIKK